MGLSLTVSELNGDFGRKRDIFPHPVYFALSLKGFPLGIWYRRWGQKTRMMGLPSPTSVGAEAPCAVEPTAPAFRNVAVVSHGQYVPAAAAA